jgi:hypothetical protein
VRMADGCEQCAGGGERVVEGRVWMLVVVEGGRKCLRERREGGERLRERLVEDEWAAFYERPPGAAATPRRVWLWPGTL